MRGTSTQLVFSLFFFFFFMSTTGLMAETPQSTTVSVKVGVVLDMNTRVGKMGLRCISMALTDFYSSHAHYKTRILLNVRDSNGSVVDSAKAALDLLKNVQVQAIIGPVTSMQANFLINLGDEAQVPIISFSATSPSLSSLRSPYFIQAALNDSSQVKALTAITQAFEWREVVLIYMDNEYGEGIIPYLIDSLKQVNTVISYKSKIHRMATDKEIVEELTRLTRLQCRVFIVHMFSSLGTRFFIKAKELGMMSEGYVWILTDGITNSLNLIDPSVIDSMQGVIGVKPHVPRSKRLEDFITRWKVKTRKENSVNDELNIYGLWAYDAATALAMAVEEVSSKNNSPINKNLWQAFSSTRFKGLSGNFGVFNGQLQSSAFEIVNVIEIGERRIGFWTRENGIVRKLNAVNRTKYSASSAEFRAIIWPGDTTKVPKGWVVPKNGKVLRIGVPKKDGLSDFVRVTKDPNTNQTVVSGYCKEVFDATMAAMPYRVPYDYIPFETPDGKSAGGMDDLLYQVFLGNFDAAVGDITITVNRSSFVDFTLPYTESGVTMIVPFKENKYKNAWIFLKPLTWDLWVISACFFVFVGFVIWILEHQVNDDFRGRPLQQVGTGFWFSFSTMIFTKRDRVVSNLARFVVIVWCFVVLILTQSYTASLTSLLTVQRLEPSISELRDLIINEKNVGYPKGSFVKGLLKGMEFKESQLKVYNTMDDLNLALSNRSIVAGFDEIPYLRLFVARHRSKYTMVSPVHKSGGFGFAFPKGSPLVPDVSRAILKVIEKDKMAKIETSWIGALTNCPDSQNLVSSTSLSIGSFWGLFLIVGVASSFALVIFVAMLLYEHRNFLLHLDLNAIWKIMKSEHERNGTDNRQGESPISLAIAPSPMTHWSPSRSSVSDDADGTSFGFEEEGSSLVDLRNPNLQTPLEIRTSTKRIDETLKPL